MQPGTNGGWLNKITPLVESKSATLLITLLFSFFVIKGMYGEMTRQQATIRELFTTIQQVRMEQLAFAEKYMHCTPKGP